jgi:hypothetical protein
MKGYDLLILSAKLSFLRVLGILSFAQKFVRLNFASVHLLLEVLKCSIKLPLLSSSGSIVSDYRLDDQEIEVRSPAGSEDFSSSSCVQTGSGAHPASYPMGTGGPFPGGKAQSVRNTDYSPPSIAEVKNE